MAYDEGLAERLREQFDGYFDVTEKNMFGGIAWMLQGNMFCGIIDDSLMARVGPEQYDEALRQPHAGKMEFTGRPMTGFVTVSPAGIENDEDLAAWIDRCVAFAGALPPK